MNIDNLLYIDEINIVKLSNGLLKSIFNRGLSHLKKSASKAKFNSLA
jgi:hypothetical protein